MQFWFCQSISEERLDISFSAQKGKVVAQEYLSYSRVARVDVIGTNAQGLI